MKKHTHLLDIKNNTDETTLEIAKTIHTDIYDFIYNYKMNFLMNALESENIENIRTCLEAEPGLIQTFCNEAYQKIISRKINPQAAAKMIEILAEHAPDLKAGLMLWAVKTNNSLAVEYLFNRDPQLIHTTDEKGRTPLLLAIIYEHSDIINFFKEKVKTDPNFEDKAGFKIFKERYMNTHDLSFFNHPFNTNNMHQLLKKEQITNLFQVYAYHQHHQNNSSPTCTKTTLNILKTQ